jgi:hypothetical protein
VEEEACAGGLTDSLFTFVHERRAMAIANSEKVRMKVIGESLGSHQPAK